MPVPNFLDYCGFVVEPEVGERNAPSFILPSQDCFGYSWSFVFPYEFLNYLFQFVEECVGNLIGIASNLYIALGRMAILMILILPSQEHGMSVHLLVTSLISLNSVL